MYEIAHLEKFLEGHPERTELLSRAAEAAHAHEDNLVNAGLVAELIGADEEQRLGRLVTSDREYMKISVAGIVSRQ